jgi:2-polyprenyl-3-methyl-5-hydroxy-6-metoxy-1,4-benzoquinol methylase
MDIEEYSKYKHFFTGEIPNLLMRELALANWKTYLDLGCGDGSLLYVLDKKGYFIGKTVFAVDLSENRINLVKKINKDFVCFVADACNVSQIESNNIDFLVSEQVIEHVDDDEKMIIEIARILKKNGTAYISTVFKKRYAWYFYRCNGKWVLDPTHVREYTEDDQLLNIFKKYGFDIIESKKIPVKRFFSDFIFKRSGIDNRVYINYPFLQLIRNISIPIFGYYNWEIICRKK